ncbi:MAG: energy-coupling factor ABC transporter permease [Dehalococcoidales bacterium]|jgi:cobalt/nickel transport system permease protein|nr:energy-coupling factor ABC transporter permease [Dehalococcoidales bacterium]
MHIPDGFLNIATVATTSAISAGGIAAAIKITGKQLKEKQVPLMGVMGAFIFAAQMLNFPIAGGTSGHFMGAALAAILLGPWAGMLIMTCVLIAQCLIFQDGGLIALGANVLNMGLIGSFSGYGIYRLVTLLAGQRARSRLIAGFAGSWAAIVLASIACALELAVSGASPLKVVLPAMAGVHALIGLVEGAITVAVLGVIIATRADLLGTVRVKAGGDAK